MPNNQLLRFGKCLLGIAVLLAWARPASANAVSYIFTATSADGHGSVTCSYGLDDGSDSIVGPWSCSGEFGTISSSDSSSGAFVVEGLQGPGTDTFFFHQQPVGGVSVTFTTADPSDSGAILLGDFADILGDHGDSFGSVTPTPEPSSLLLLATGLLGLGLAAFQVGSDSK